MNRPVIGLVGRQPIVSVSASACVRGPSVCVALQSRGRWRCLSLWLPLLHWPHCSALCQRPFIKSLAQNGKTVRMVSFCEISVMRSLLTQKHTQNVNMMHFSAHAYAWIKCTVYPTHTSAGTCRPHQPGAVALWSTKMHLCVIMVSH